MPVFGGQLSYFCQVFAPPSNVDRLGEVEPRLVLEEVGEERRHDVLAEIQ